MILHGQEVKIQVDDIQPFDNDKYYGFKILWSGNIGWGEYTIYKIVGDNKWYIDDEYMENPRGDTSFLRLLLENFTEQICK